jgi:hypothetical protein
MKLECRAILSIVVFFSLALCGFGQTLPPEIKAKAEAEIQRLKALETDPEVIAAVKAHNSAADYKDMTNEKWKSLSVLDPVVRSFSKNALAEHLRSKKDDAISELFVSGADGCKVAFFSKTSYWTHKGKPKHEVPMTGKTYIGAVEVDESTGQQQFQVGLPVLDGGKPIGSIVVGLRVASLR